MGAACFLCVALTEDVAIGTADDAANPRVGGGEGERLLRKLKGGVDQGGLSVPAVGGGGSSSIACNSAIVGLVESEVATLIIGLTRSGPPSSSDSVSCIGGCSSYSVSSAFY